MVNEKKRDLVDRNAVLDQAYLYVMDGELAKMIDERAVMRLPKVDAVEVVRCKDCKAFVRNSRVDTDRGDCYRYGIGCVRIKKIDDFCSYGERREVE